MKLTEWYQQSCAPLNITARDAALARQAQLTKPPGALGRLEDIAVQIAAMQGNVIPSLEKVHIAVFAGDHGIARKGISAFPQEVTTEMVRNFSRGGAAISVLARQLAASLEVINVGTVQDHGPLEGVLKQRIAPGTEDFSEQAAMHQEQLEEALEAGRQSATRALQNKVQLYIGGEMGIGNTTAASAVASVLLAMEPEKLCGPGTGLDASGVARKAELIRRALALHQLKPNEPFEVLRCLGGFEIAALAGAYISCASYSIPVLVDGFISSVAALVALSINPSCAHWYLYSHSSAEPGYQYVMQGLKAQPLLDLGMRLGEGSGAAVAVPVLRLACDLHSQMATFDQAGVSEKV